MLPDQFLKNKSTEDFLNYVGTVDASTALVSITGRLQSVSEDEDGNVDYSPELYGVQVMDHYYAQIAETYEFMTEDYDEFIRVYRETTKLLYEALYSEVIATQELVRSLPEGSKFLSKYLFDSSTEVWEELTVVYHYLGDRIVTSKGRRVSISDIVFKPNATQHNVIRSNNCSKTLEHILKFTTKGVRIERALNDPR